MTFFSACKEVEKGPLVGGNGIPGSLGNIKVENLPGAAKITYSMPDEQSLLYVLAEYTNDHGQKKEVKSSVYKNYVLLEGFGTTNKVDVSLYTVDRAENRSEPFSIQISPLKAPVHTVFETLKVIETFGGVNMTFTNEQQQEYIVHTLYRDSTGEWVDYDRLYSSAESTNYSVRGFESEPVDFAFYFTDKWKNNSDTLLSTLTPLYEEEMDKSLWKDADLIDDFNDPLYSPLYQLWTPGATTYFFQNRNNAQMVGMPNWVTIDLGKAYIFGRMKLNQVSHSNTWRYGSCTPQVFEVYGSNEATPDWNAWTLLGRFESIKPSGLPVGQLSDEDLRVNAAGEDYDFPASSESYRYIRFKTLRTWGGVNYMCVLELTFWGQEAK